MKTIQTFMIACLLACSISAAVAQTPMNDTTKKTMPSQTNPSMSQNYVILKNGKIMEYKDGKMSALTSDYSCSNGCKVSPSGKITKSDGTSMQLMEGDKVYKDGRIEAAKANPDKSPDNPQKDPGSDNK